MEALTKRQKKTELEVAQLKMLKFSLVVKEEEFKLSLNILNELNKKQ